MSATIMTRFSRLFKRFRLSLYIFNGVYMLLYSSGHCSGIHLSVATLKALKQSLLVTDNIFVA